MCGLNAGSFHKCGLSPVRAVLLLLLLTFAGAELMMEQTDDSAKSYEAGILNRLRTIKAAADPLNLFRSLDYVHPN